MASTLRNRGVPRQRRSSCAAGSRCHHSCKEAYAADNSRVLPPFVVAVVVVVAVEVVAVLVMAVDVDVVMS